MKLPRSHNTGHGTDWRALALTQVTPREPPKRLPRGWQGTRLVVPLAPARGRVGQRHRGVDGLTSHFVAAIAAGRICALAFWWHGYVELEVVDSHQQASNIAGKHLLL